VTEKEWLTTKDPVAMLTWARIERPTYSSYRSYPDNWRPMSDRQVRLLGVACCRQVWQSLIDGRSRKAVQVAERFADGLATPDQVRIAGAGAKRALYQANPLFEVDLPMRCLGPVGQLTDNNGLPRWFSVSNSLAAAQADLIRDIGGNPFQPVELEPTFLAGRRGCRRAGSYYTQPPGGVLVCPTCGDEAVLHWHPWLTPDVRSLAQAAYDERPGRECDKCQGCGSYKRIRGLPAACNVCDGEKYIPDGPLNPHRLAILADALEEAGCPSVCESPCPRCSPYHDDEKNPFHEPGYHPERDPASGRHEGGWTNCKTCKGGGVVRADNPLLQHLRSLGPHVRGCWVLDLLLGKE